MLLVSQRGNLSTYLNNGSLILRHRDCLIPWLGARHFSQGRLGEASARTGLRPSHARACPPISSRRRQGRHAQAEDGHGYRRSPTSPASHHSGRHKYLRTLTRRDSRSFPPPSSTSPILSSLVLLLPQSSSSSIPERGRTRLPFLERPNYPSHDIREPGVHCRPRPHGASHPAATSSQRPTSDHHCERC